MSDQFDLRPESPLRTRVEAFALEYEALCRKHNLVISGCGCCGSPFLIELEHEKNTPHVCIDNFDLTDMEHGKTLEEFARDYLCDHNI